MHPAKAILVGIYVLLTVRIPHLYLSNFFCDTSIYQTAKGVTASYDSLEYLFGCVGSFLKRVHIYANTPLTPSMTDIIIKIMAELLSVLALSTTQIKQGRLSKSLVVHESPSVEPVTEKFGKTLFGEREIEAVLQRLDRLTQEEAQMALAQTLEGVYGLANNTKMILDGGKTLSAWLLRLLK